MGENKRFAANQDFRVKRVFWYFTATYKTFQIQITLNLLIYEKLKKAGEH